METAFERPHRGSASIAIVGFTLLLAALYAVPHVWWMFGVSTAFPGESADLEGAFQRTWFVVYNLITTGLVLGGAAAITALERRWTLLWRRPLRLLVLIGAILLLLRGGLGMLTSVTTLGSSDSELVPFALAWELWFVLSGVLYAVVFRRHG